MKSMISMKGYFAVAVIAPMIVLGGCAPGNDERSGRDLYPDVGERTSALPGCGAALVAWNGSTAYSNGEDTGTGESCAGDSEYGLKYQCVELVMRHFEINWGLSWMGNAEDLLDYAPAHSVDVYFDGDKAHPPVPGDMIVFGGGEVGHVALVTAVSSSEVTIIEQNVPSSFTRRLAIKDGKVSPGWRGWWTKGWAHAKANGGEGGEPGSWACGDSAFGGQQYWTCENGARHRCEGGMPVEEACEHGCMSRWLGADDLCISNTEGWDCANSAYRDYQVWTCSGGSLFRCSGGTPHEVVCPKGCAKQESGMDDLCQ